MRTFLDTDLPRSLADKVRSRQTLAKGDIEAWHAILHRKGWLAGHWPVEWGGPGWTVAERFIFEQEAALAHAPRILPFGISMLGPVLIAYGTDAQKRHWLPRVLDGSDWWAQGFSEPGAGSDLASLRTTAIREGDAYVVNGQKTWTTLAQHADMMFCLVRTDPAAKPQEGISFLMIDLRSPGVEIRPITTLDGEHEVNEVFLTDVHVPVANRVGDENRGWTYAKYLLTYERTNIAGIGASESAFQRLKDLAGRQRRRNRPLSEDPLFGARLARLEIELENMKTTNLRILAAAAHGAAPGWESSMLKIKGTEIRQEITSLTRRALGPSAQAWRREREAPFANDGVEAEETATATADYLNTRKLSIFGGSNEIQRTIVARAILGPARGSGR